MCFLGAGQLVEECYLVVRSLHPLQDLRHQLLRSHQHSPAYWLLSLSFRQVNCLTSFLSEKQNNYSVLNKKLMTNK